MFAILNRREAGTERCPRCSRVNVDFMDLGDGVLGCFDCGTVFIRKTRRIEIRKRGGVPGPFMKPPLGEIKIDPPVTVLEVPIILKETLKVLPLEVPFETAAPPVVYTCGTCGKELKTRLALAGHMRSHK